MTDNPEWAFGQVALVISVLGGVFGFIYSIFATLKQASEREDKRATWEPFPFTLGMALFWPAMIILLPVFTWQDRVAATSTSPSAGFIWGVRLAYGLAALLMIAYVAAIYLW